MKLFNGGIVFRDGRKLFLQYSSCVYGLYVQSCADSLQAFQRHNSLISISISVFSHIFCIPPRERERDRGRKEVGKKKKRGVGDYEETKA